MNTFVSWLCVISIFIVCANCLKFIFTALFDQPFSEPVRQQGKTLTHTVSQGNYNMQRASGESYYKDSVTASASNSKVLNTYKGTSGAYNTSGTYNAGSLAYASHSAPRSYEEYRKTHKISR